MTTITGQARTLSMLASSGAQLRWKYSPVGAVVGGMLVDSQPDVTTPCGPDGKFSQPLTGGVYELTIDGNAKDRWTVTVPDDDLTYDISEILGNLSIPQVAAVPNASSSVPGILKTNSDPSPSPGVVYLKAEVDALAAAPLVVGSPEGAVIAVPGSLRWEEASGILWLKRTGTGNTGWFALITL